MSRHAVTAALAAAAALMLGGAGAASAQSALPGSAGTGPTGSGSLAHTPVSAGSLDFASLQARAIVGSVGAVAAGSPVEEPSAVGMPVGPYVVDHFLTPDRPEFWNPLVTADRLVSPFGTSTRIRCTSFHGVTLQCWQDDREGRPHRLVELALAYPGSTGSNQPGGGPGTYVYADPVGWATGS